MKYLIIIIVFPFYAEGQLRVAKIFTDNMVLQREHPIRIGGDQFREKKLP